ncbi:MAG: glycosyltransferase [Isosphaeraceae bacterium]
MSRPESTPGPPRIKGLSTISSSLEHEKLRVLHTATGNLYGGVETFLRTLARHRGDAPGLEQRFAMVFEGRAAGELREAGADVDVLGDVRFSRPWTILKARRALKQVLRRFRPDVVVTHGAWTHGLVAPVAHRAGLPTALWLHDILSMTHWVEKLAFRTPPALVLANSRHTAGNVPKAFPKSRCEVLYYPVDLHPTPREPARTEVRNELKTGQDDVVIVTACRLERWKGQAFLIEGLAKLVDLPGWTAWIAGGPQRPHEQVYFDELQAAAQSAGLSNRVRFLGQRRDVPRLLAAADVHCQPNTGPEPFGIAYIEALASGLPVVSTNIGGAAEIVTEACGTLVPVHDANALADALRRLVVDPACRTRLGSGGPARAAELCAPGTVLARFEELLHGVSQRADATQSAVLAHPRG